MPPPDTRLVYRLMETQSPFPEEAVTKAAPRFLGFSPASGGLLVACRTRSLHPQSALDRVSPRLMGIGKVISPRNFAAPLDDLCVRSLVDAWPQHRGLQAQRFIAYCVHALGGACFWQPKHASEMCVRVRAAVFIATVLFAGRSLCSAICVGAPRGASICVFSVRHL